VKRLAWLILVYWACLRLACDTPTAVAAPLASGRQNSSSVDDVVLRAPSSSRSVPLPTRKQPSFSGPTTVVARRQLAPVWGSYPNDVAGRLFLGQQVQGRRTGRTCVEDDVVGEWIDIGAGEACTARSFRIAQKADDMSVAPNAFVYAKVEKQGAPLFAAPPTSTTSTDGHNDDDDKPAGVKDWMNGAYFLAFPSAASLQGDERFAKTIDGAYVESAALDVREKPTLQGEMVSSTDLPLAFVVNNAEVRCLRRSDMQLLRCGRAEKWARFTAKSRWRFGGDVWVEGPDDQWVRQADLRIANRKRPPFETAAGRKWLHIDLSQQTLTAYEGHRPVYATLVSTGKDGFETPTGLHPIRRAYVSKTMEGPDPDVGRFYIEHIPWVMFYRGGYALHGAYWHDNFGNVRSHGCTNIPPADAEWLFWWAVGDELPAGWHASLDDSETYVYVTD